jgi:hypothetical protein
VRNKLGFVVRFYYAHLREAPWRIAIACSRSSSLLASVCHTKTHCPSTASAAPMAAWNRTATRPAPTHPPHPRTSKWTPHPSIISNRKLIIMFAPWRWGWFFGIVGFWFFNYSRIEERTAGSVSLTLLESKNRELQLFQITRTGGYFSS